MVFKHKFHDLDFRNDSANTQKDILDTFFQTHTIEHWEIAANEVIFATYDENNVAGATRFTILDAGVNGIKGNLDALNNTAGYAIFVANNQVIKSQTVDNRMVLIQYIPRA